ncbi:signal peptidase I SipW [Bacillus sp. SJS]|uniref:signal peptidase I SipW n=1 Tax=Bacillus sp. SJS TaxID=1423321 RepID=UPI0004DD90E4|nr:signal peptidase I [Bacillus sp. SJS]KZZ85088.1 S26 family signal peptidase [Bacillus sp. SJS]
MKAIKKVISTSITALLFIVLLLMIATVVSSKASGGEPQLLGYQMKTVLSGSMEPGIHTGSIIAVKPGGDMKRFGKNDVITFKMDETTLVTHRIIDVIKSGDQVLYKTKGDNNKTADTDPVLSDNVVAEYSGVTIPYLGYFIDFAKSKEGSALLLVLPGILLLGYSGVTIWRAMARLEEPKKLAENEKTV